MFAMGDKYKARATYTSSTSKSGVKHLILGLFDTKEEASLAIALARAQEQREAGESPLPNQSDISNGTQIPPAKKLKKKAKSKRAKRIKICKVVGTRKVVKVSNHACWRPSVELCI